MNLGESADISSSLFSCLYVVYGGGSVCSGVSVNQDVNELWELCGKVERAEGDDDVSCLSVMFTAC